MLLLAMVVTAGFWLDIPGAMSTNIGDQNQFEFVLAHGASVVADGQNPLFTTKMNFPVGMNMMANTSVLGLSIPLAPLTLKIGPHAAFLVLLTLMFALTGVSWYAMLSRTVVTSRPAALLGAAFCAFAPGMVSHGNAHPNIVGQFLVPIIIWRTLTLRRPWRDGTLLALLVIWQVFINEEILLFTAVAVGIFIAVSVLLRPEHRFRARQMLGCLGVTALVAGLVLAYPLWWQFAGPQSYSGLAENGPTYGADLASFITYATQTASHSILPTPLSTTAPAPNPTEENAYFGLPLLLLVAGLIWWLRHNRTVIALAVVAGVFALLSLGPIIEWWGTPVIDGPWSLLANLPLLSSVVPGRLALVDVAVLGILLALGADRVRALISARPWTAAALALAFAAALLPIAPTPLMTVEHSPTPTFLLNGEIDRYVAPDRAIMFVPPTRNKVPAPMGWLAEAGLRYNMTHGYFLQPMSDPAYPRDRRGVTFTPPRPTSEWLYEVRRTGVVPHFTLYNRAQAIRDLRAWRVDAMVLGKGWRRGALHKAVTALIGIKPQRLGEAWIWDVRALVAGPPAQPPTGTEACADIPLPCPAPAPSIPISPRE